MRKVPFFKKSTSKKSSAPVGESVPGGSWRRRYGLAIEKGPRGKAEPYGRNPRGELPSGISIIHQRGRVRVSSHFERGVLPKESTTTTD